MGEACTALLNDDLADHASATVRRAVVSVLTGFNVESAGVGFAGCESQLLVRQFVGNVFATRNVVLIEDDVVRSHLVIFPSDGVAFGNGDSGWFKNEQATVGAHFDSVVSGVGRSS